MTLSPRGVLRRAAWLPGLLLVLGGLECSDVTTDLASDQPLKTTPGKDAGSDAARAALADAATDARVPTMCGEHVCQCDDGRDNDGDTLIDGFDPECTSPYDDDESSFGTGTSRTNAKCRGCFWNESPSPAADNCRYPRECLTGELPAMGGPPDCSTCDVSASCVQSCQPRTPNGCDCFGCCEIIKRDGTKVPVLLNDRCSLAKVEMNDESACPRCIQDTSCLNACSNCELCPGRTIADLPQLCNGVYDCQDAAKCSAEKPCPAGAYCQLGCCLYVVQ